jgi:hypothetical protein
MLPDYARYNGSALVQIIDHCLVPISIEKLSDAPQGFYLLAGKAPLYLKFSRRRKGPWGFTVHREHQIHYQRLVDRYGDCILALVCGKDGIAALNYAQVREVLDDNFEDQEGVTVRRRLNHMYSVVGTNGRLSSKIARDALINQISLMLGKEVVAPSEVPTSQGVAVRSASSSTAYKRDAVREDVEPTLSEAGDRSHPT